MTQQVIPLMLDFKDILAGKAGFFLNLQNAGGMNFFGVFFFFLASPFTFLVAFLEKADVYYLVNVLVLFKLSLASVTASCFFHYENPRRNRILHLAICVSYGLCGYGLLYYQNIVWLDVLCVFPLVMLGFLKLVNGGKRWPFVCALSLLVVFNYYLSYMVFLALILFSALFLKFCVPQEKRGEAAGKIGSGAILSLLLTAVVWVPSFLQCLRSARTDQGLIEILQHSAFFTNTSTTLPVLLCTAFVLCIPALLWYHPATPKRKALLLSLLLTSLPLVIEPVNKLWHTGSYQAFPARYGYIPLFLVLWYAADLWSGEESCKLPTARSQILPAAGLFAIAGATVGIGSFLLGFQYGEITSYNRSLWIDTPSIQALLLFALALAIAVWIADYFYRTNRIGKNLLCGFFLLLTLIQGGYHAVIYVTPTANEPNLSRAVLNTAPPADAGLYRAKLDYKFTNVNLIGAAGQPTLNHYTSLTDSGFLHTLKKLGYSSYWMETSACCGTKFSDFLLSNKYALKDTLEWVPTGGGDLGYLLPSGSLPREFPQGGRLEAQDELYRQIMGTSAFQKYLPNSWSGQEPETRNGLLSFPKSEVAVLRYEIPVEGEETLYFDAFGENTNSLTEPINGRFQVFVNGHSIQDQYPSQACNGILELGTFQRETVLVELQIYPVLDLTSFGVYGLPTEKLKAFTGKLTNAQLRQEGGRILGMADADEENTSLFLSIPYAPGMKAKVNGEEVELQKVLDCFLTIPLDRGENEIEFSYFPTELIPGIVLSAVGLLVLLGGFLLRKTVFFRKLPDRWRRTAYPLLWAAFGAVLLLIYTLPIGVWCLGLFN